MDENKLINKDIFGLPCKMLEMIFSLENQGKYIEAISRADYIISRSPSNYNALYVKSRIQVKMSTKWRQYPNLKLLDEAERGFNKVHQLLGRKENVQDIIKLVQYWQGVIFDLRGLQDRIKPECNSMPNSNSKKIKELREDDIKNLEYKDRKFIMPVSVLPTFGTPEIKTIRINQIPKCINFPLGHPIANELYICHPYNQSLYVPYKDFELEFSLEKINELSFLLQCLGATEISVTVLKGENTRKEKNSGDNLGASASFMGFSASGELNNKSANKEHSASTKLYTTTQKFDPLKKPYVPNNLIWLPHLADWQRLVHQRLDGNMLTFQQTISSKESKFVSSFQEDEIKAAVKILWFKVGFSNKESFNSMFHKENESVWQIDAKFRSMREFR